MASVVILQLVLAFVVVVTRHETYVPVFDCVTVVDLTTAKAT